MKRKRIYFVCFALVVFTLLCNINCVVKKQGSMPDIEIIAKAVTNEVKEGQNVIVDVDVKNNSDNSIYNVEILTEAPNKDYAQAYGNVICKTAEEVAAGNKLNLRATYTRNVLDVGSVAFEGYKIKGINKVLVILWLVVYMILMLLLLKFLVKDNKKLNMDCLCLMFVLSIGVSIFIRKISICTKDTSIINSYEEYVDVNIAGKKQRVKVIVNYTIESLESLIDKNENGILDVEEKEDFKRDTDGDGLPDFYELYMCGTNPYMLDSYSIGLGDVNYDTDEDGLSNLEEYNLGCNPLNKDTDYDGLSDFEEIELGTKVLEWDTDSDGMSDGFEVEQGYNPLLKDINVIVLKELTSNVKEPKNRVTARVEVNTAVTNAESLDIETYETILVNENVPGYIGSAFEFSIDDSFDSAEISFEIDKYWLNKKDCDPCIYYFNEETQLLEELDTIIDGTILSTRVEHFSIYVVLDRSKVNEWMYKDIFIQEVTPGFEGMIHGADIAFIIDNSQSIEQLDPNGYLKDLSKKFIDVLSNEKDTASLIMFTKEVKLLRDFSNNFDELSNLVLSIERDSGHEKDSGTDIVKGLEKGLELFSNRDSEHRRYMILLTDGDVDWRSFNKEGFVKKLKAERISLYCVDIGSYSADLLKYVCEHTGGQYYVAGDILDEAISKGFETIEEHVVNPTGDSNNDGISDADTETIISGVLRTGTGVKLFEDCDLTLLRGDISDIDGDGLLNGEEMSIERLNGVTYLKLNSHPFKADTDDDNIVDNDDTAPFTPGQKGGVIGELYLAVHPTSVDVKSGLTWFLKLISFKKPALLNLSNTAESGHTWLVIHSYCNINFESKELRQGYIKCKFGDNQPEFVARHNLYPYKLVGNSYMSIGYYPKDEAKVDGWDDNISDKEIGQILLKQHQLRDAGLSEEADKLNDYVNEDLRINQEFKNSQKYNYYKGAIAIKQEITYKQLKKMTKYFDSLPVYFMPTYNCTDFAVHSWNLCSDLNNSSLYIPYDVYTMGVTAVPLRLYDNLYYFVEKDFQDFMYSRCYDMLPNLVFDDNGILIP